jgi:tRNA dimethylallyltransferase
LSAGYKTPWQAAAVNAARHRRWNNNSIERRGLAIRPRRPHGASASIFNLIMPHTKTPKNQDKKLPKILVIVGPTASGKSDLAVEIARGVSREKWQWKSLAERSEEIRGLFQSQFSKAEIISADSRQVYRGMNIGSGKITKREMKGVPHHLLDVADPNPPAGGTFSVAQYQKLAHAAIADILNRGKLPIVVGGTGFYIQSIVDNIILPEVPPNPSLRKKLTKLSPAQLFTKLKKLDLVRAKTIDNKNPVRLIRAIEITTALGRVPKVKSKPLYDATIIGLNPDEKTLKQKIHRRLLARLKIGMVAEVKKLHAGGLSWKKLEAFGLEYRYIAQFLQKKITNSEMIATLEHAIYCYAKRQMTWFKRDKRIKWVP